MYHGSTLWQTINTILALVTNLTYLQLVARAPDHKEFDYMELEMNQNINNV